MRTTTTFEQRPQGSFGSFGPPPRDRGRGDGGGDDESWGNHWPDEGDGGPYGAADVTPQSDGSAQFALTLAMVGITTLFVIFLASWVLLRRFEEDPMRDSPLVPPAALWLSTLVLGASSYTLERAARLGASMAGPSKTHRWLARSLFLGTVFLLAQGWLWATLVRGGVVPSSGAYGAVFFSLTLLHAVHVIGGLGAMIAMHNRLARYVLTASSLRLCATYWHFMGVLWGVIFVVLYFAR